MSWLAGLIAFEKIIEMLSGWYKAIREYFKKDPIKQISDAEKAHEEGVKNAEKNDDTSDIFGSK